MTCRRDGMVRHHWRKHGRGARCSRCGAKVKRPPSERRARQKAAISGWETRRRRQRESDRMLAWYEATVTDKGWFTKA